MFRIKFFIFSLLCAGLFLTSCEDDGLGGGGTTGGGGGTSADAPFVSLQDDLDVISSDATLTPGSTFRVKFDVTSNVAQLKAIEVVRDGFSLSTSEFDNIDIDDAEENNPQLLFGDDKDGLTWTYEFVAPDTQGAYLYDFIATDESDLDAIASLTITIEEPLEVINPTLELQASSTIEAPANSLVKVNVAATKGTFDIASISVWEDGSLMDASRLRFNDVVMEANPLPLFAPDTEGFTGGVTIATTTGDHNYVIRVTDSEDNNADVSFDIVEQINTTPLQNTFSFIFFSNASGPSFGGLDLDAGVAVSSSSVDAEIRDRGIDTGLPAASNWLQEVEGVNGSELRIVDVTSLDGLAFEDVASKELVAAAFNGGTPVASSPALQPGDLLAVSSPTNLYLIKVETVTVTTSDNDDNYEFSIKY